AKAPPRTGAGGVALARAHLALGDRTKAREWIRRTWRGFDLSESMEKTVIKEMGDLIDSADHRHRLALMIYRHQAKAAARAAAYLPKSYQAMARAAAAYLRRSKSAGTLFYKLPVSLQNDPAITYVRVFWHRKADRDDTARKLVLSAKLDAARKIHPEAWWEEQRLLARSALVPGDKKTYRTAYWLVSEHALTSGAEYVDAEFMSGWIALRF